ncbi:MerR family transcriptional regulator [Saccharopolyspora erythraea]|uniref:HTH merR-type domain-containing protein n=2 Tax=Saccharopolyspora erythraea TaxID=1836 RepID=A0ABP3N8K9_SACER|nr:MerR family transcriptional regulator [Saccharopolyspora erythraea]EQD86314.1 regulatory protein MerR [Saccharopolyspora erythraea D]QRK89754.1 MerR family transcriptional regulator [Saccharopolyspora erythraea]
MAVCDVEPPLIRSTELANKLCLSRRTISLYAKQGLITPAIITPGGQYRWRYDDVLAEMRKLAEECRAEHK